MRTLGAVTMTAVVAALAAPAGAAMEDAYGIAGVLVETFDGMGETGSDAPPPTRSPRRPVTSFFAVSI